MRKINKELRFVMFFLLVVFVAGSCSVGLTFSEEINLTIINYVQNDTYMNLAGGIDVEGDYAYVVGYSSNSLAVVDVSNPSNLLVVGGVINSTYMDGARGVYVEGDYAYVVGRSSDSLAVVDVSDKSNPFVVGGVINSTYLDDTQGVYVKGDYAYVTGRGSSSLAVVDVSNPGNPQIVGGVINSTYLGNANDLYVQDDYAYVTGYGPNSLAVVDISNPSDPLVVGGVISSTYMEGATGVHLQGDYAYVTGYGSNSLAVVDISNPSDPLVVGGVISSTYMEGAWRVGVQGDYAYVTGRSSDSLAVVNISNPSNPQIVGGVINSTYLGGAYGVYVGEGYTQYYVYLAGGDFNNLGIISVDIFKEFLPTSARYFLSDQGTGVREISSGNLLDGGNLTIEIYDSRHSGGNLIYSETFLNAINEGKWDVMLGENFPLNLTYGKTYYKHYKINGEDGKFNDEVHVNKQPFYSTVREIENTTNLTIGDYLDFGFGEMIDNLVDGWLRITGGLEVSDSANFEGDVDFNGGWNNDGVSFVGGDIFTKSLYVEYIGDTLTAVDDIQVNGSIIPELDGQFDIGNSSSEWDVGYFSEMIYVNGNKVCLENGTNCPLSSIAELEDKWLDNSSQVYIKEDYPQYFNVSDVLFVNGTSGDVGIGVNPQENLHIKGNISQEDYIHLANSFYVYEDLGVAPYAIYVQKYYAYVVGHYSHSLAIYDIYNPNNPRVIGSVSDGTHLGGANNVFASGDYAYVTGSDSLGIVDMSNKSNISIAGSVTNLTYLNLAKDVDVQGDYAYVTGAYSNSLTVIDVSNKSNPVIVGGVINNTLDFADRLEVQGDYAYVLGGGLHNLAVVDISNRSNLSIVGSVNNSTYMDSPRDIFVEGNYAYVTGFDSDSLAVIDISNPSNPLVVGGVNDSVYLDSAFEIDVQGDYAYVLKANENILTLVNISNPLIPKIENRIIFDEIPNSKGMDVQGDYIYIVGGNNLFSIGLSAFANLLPTSAGSVNTDFLNVNYSSFFENKVFVENKISGENLFVEGSGSFGGSLFCPEIKIGGEDSTPFVALDVEGDSDVQAKFGDNLPVYIQQNRLGIGFNVYDGIFGHGSLNNYASSIEGDTTYGGIIFKTSPNPGDFGDVAVMEDSMILDKDGNLGIGKSPEVKLDVEGDANISGEVHVGGDINLGLDYDVLGEMEAKEFSLTYIAPSDGFYLVNVLAENNGDSINSTLFVNNVRRSVLSAQYNSASSIVIPYNSAIIPVQEGDEYNMTVTSVGSPVINASFTPFG